MKSTMTAQQYFNHVSQPQIQRSKFDRSHGYKTTMNAGPLIPVYVGEALPGDTVNMKINVFGRFATLIKPIMDNIFIDVHFFSVPERLVWDNWQKFNGEQKNPNDTTSFIMPTVTAPVGGYTEASLHDYMGLPTKIAGLENRTDFLRAYALIWNEWYRDENLQNSTYCPTGDGPDDPAQQLLLPRGKRKDYFTSALPFAQKHDPVLLPIGGQAPLAGFADVVTNSEPPTMGNTSQGYGLVYKPASPSRLNADISGDPTITPGNLLWGVTGMEADLAEGTGYADLSAATAVTINALREAATVQQLYELDAVGGTRYTEIIRAHFGVISPDARLQRPEYLGGATAYINVNAIAQTTPSETETPQANLAAMATTTMMNKGFVKSFTEHEIIIGLASIRADLNYQQGLDRMWSRSTRFDFYWPTFANLGEQAILNKEIYAQGTPDDDEVFGYAERYAEYRYQNSIITGLFRSNAATSLDVWGLWQDFSALPALNGLFIQENPPIARVVAVTTEPAIILDAYFQETWARPMPTFSTPGLTKF